MNFKQLNPLSQLIIIGELSGVKLNQMMPHTRYIQVSEGPSTGLPAELESHGLSCRVLNSLGNGRLHVDFGFSKPNAFVINRPNSNYINISKEFARDTYNPLMLQFGSVLTKSELDECGLDDGTVTGVITIHEDDDIRDALTSAHAYIGACTTNPDVTQVLQQLIEGYDKALMLPADLLERITTWTPISSIIDNLTSKIIHSYSDYYTGSDDDDEQSVPLPQGRNVFNIHRNFGNGGFTVGYDHNAADYTGYRLSFAFVPSNDSEGGKLKIGLTYQNLDNVALSETEVTPSMTVSDLLDSIVTTFKVIKNDKEWGTIVTPLVDHAVGVIEEVKPFIVATLK